MFLSLGSFICHAHEFGAIKEPNARAVFTRTVEFTKERDAQAFAELIAESYPDCGVKRNGFLVHLPQK